MPFGFDDAAMATIAVANAANTGRMNKKNREFQLQMYNRQLWDNRQNWRLQNEYNSPQQQMQRFKEAGLNPNLIYGQMNNGASIDSTKMGQYTGQAAQVDPNIISNIQQMQNLKEQNQLIRSQVAVQEAQAADLQAAMALKTANAEQAWAALYRYQKENDLYFDEKPHWVQGEGMEKEYGLSNFDQWKMSKMAELGITLNNEDITYQKAREAFEQANAAELKNQYDSAVYDYRLQKEGYEAALANERLIQEEITTKLKQYQNANGIDKQRIDLELEALNIELEKMREQAKYFNVSENPYWQAGVGLVQTGVGVAAGRVGKRAQNRPYNQTTTTTKKGNQTTYRTEYGN